MYCSWCWHYLKTTYLNWIKEFFILKFLFKRLFFFLQIARWNIVVLIRFFSHKSIVEVLCCCDHNLKSIKLFICQIQRKKIDNQTDISSMLFYLKFFSYQLVLKIISQHFLSNGKGIRIRFYFLNQFYLMWIGDLNLNGIKEIFNQKYLLCFYLF